MRYQPRKWNKSKSLIWWFLARLSHTLTVWVWVLRYPLSRSLSRLECADSALLKCSVRIFRSLCVCTQNWRYRRNWQLRFSFSFYTRVVIRSFTQHRKLLFNDSIILRELCPSSKEKVQFSELKKTKNRAWVHEQIVFLVNKVVFYFDKENILCFIFIRTSLPATLFSHTLMSFVFQSVF